MMIARITMSKRRWAALAALLVLLILFTVLFFIWSDWRRHTAPRPDPDGVRWLSDVYEPNNQVRIHMTVIGEPFTTAGEFIWRPTYYVAGDPKSHEGVIGRYRCQASGDGEITVTLISKLREGREIIKAEDQQPKNWRFEMNADGSLEIRCPRQDGEQTFRFQRKETVN